MREMSVAEQRYQAVLAVIADGRTIKEVAEQWSVSRQTLHAWLARYEADGEPPRDSCRLRSHERGLGSCQCPAPRFSVQLF
jgi:transposase-like protein